MMRPFQNEENSLRFIQILSRLQKSQKACQNRVRQVTAGNWRTAAGICGQRPVATGSFGQNWAGVRYYHWASVKGFPERIA